MLSSGTPGAVVVWEWKWEKFQEDTVSSVTLIELEEPTRFCTYNPHFRSEIAATDFKYQWRRSALGLTDDVGQLNCLEKKKVSLHGAAVMRCMGHDTGSCAAPQCCTHAHNFIWTSNKQELAGGGHSCSAGKIGKIQQFLPGAASAVSRAARAPPRRPQPLCGSWGWGWRGDRCGDCNYALCDAASAKPKCLLLLLARDRFTSAGKHDVNLFSKIVEKSHLATG